MPADLLRERVGQSIWDPYFKFCVVRNPYDKVISAFYFWQYRKQGYVEFGDLDSERAKLENWLLACKDIRHALLLPIDYDRYTIDGKFCMDSVIRYESLTADMERICNHLNLPWEPSFLPTFKAGIRPPDAKTADLYTPMARKIVEVIFATELTLLNYSFPGDDDPPIQESGSTPRN